MDNRNKKQNGGGIFSAIAALVKGGAAAGGAAGASAAGGIFATKAGILGLLLGGATIAAGAGAVYHLAGGGATKTAYTPELFQNSYYEEQAAIAEAERAQRSDRRSSVVNSTIGMFSQQAKKIGLGFGSGSEFSEEMPENTEGSELADEARGNAADAGYADYDYSGASAAASSSSKGGRLAAKSMSSAGGGATSTSGSKTVVPRMKSMGGLSGGVNSKFASMKSAGLAEGGKSSRMSASAKRSSAKGRPASPRAGGNKNAYAQARFANAMGNKAVYSASSSGARTAAAAAFTGETTGGDDISVGAIDGAGMGGAGISMADGLKSNNPNSNRSVKNVPDVGGSENASPWKDLENKIMIAIASATVLLLLGSMLAKTAAKKRQEAMSEPDPKIKAAKLAAAMAWYAWTAAVAGAVAVLGVAISAMSLVIATKYEQKMMGAMYGIAGIFMAIKGAMLLKKAIDGRNDAKDDYKVYNSKEFQEGRAQAMEQMKGKTIELDDGTRLNPGDQGYDEALANKADAAGYDNYTQNNSEFNTGVENRTNEIGNKANKIFSGEKSWKPGMDGYEQAKDAYTTNGGTVSDDGTFKSNFTQDQVSDITKSYQATTDNQKYIHDLEHMNRLKSETMSANAGLPTTPATTPSTVENMVNSGAVNSLSNAMESFSDGSTYDDSSSGTSSNKILSQRYTPGTVKVVDGVRYVANEDGMLVADA